MLLSSTLPAESSSITLNGGMRPPKPTTVGVIAGPGPVETTVGVTISVVVRFANALLVGEQLGKQPGRNSCTRPLTVTESPTATPGAEPVKTKMPSDVATLESGCGSWYQKPFEPTAVTTPGTWDTRAPS